MSALSHVGRDVWIHQNGIQHVNGLSSLSTVGLGVLLVENYSLNNVNGLSGLTTVGSNGIVIDGSSLQDLDGLDSSLSSLQALTVANNSRLTDISGIDGISTVGRLGINDNAILCQYLVDAYVSAIQITDPAYTDTSGNNSCS